MHKFKIHLLVIVALVNSQLTLGQMSFSNTNNGRLLDLTGVNGRTMLNNKYDPAIEGTPFLNPEWDFAKITLTNGKEIQQVFVKLNLESNELYYLDSAKNEMITVNGIVKKLYFLNFYDKDSIRYVFKTGYPKIDKQNESYFYQVYTEGKLELLMKNYKYIREIKKEFTGEISKDFIDNSQLYLYVNKTMREFKKDKSEILLLMKDKEQEINLFLSTNKINFKKIPDLIKLFNYYNSLSAAK
jgi:hypothetical protein